MFFRAYFGCHDILVSGRSNIKWRQRPYMTILLLGGIALTQTNKNEVFVRCMDYDLTDRF